MYIMTLKRASFRVTRSCFLNDGWHVGPEIRYCGKLDSASLFRAVYAGS